MERYWTNGKFEIWRGPIPSESNFHWAKFHGWTKTKEPEEIWVMEKSEMPVGLWPMTEDSARARIENERTKR